MVEKPGGAKGLWARLRDSTILSVDHGRPHVPDSVLNLMRYFSEEPDNGKEGPQSFYEHAKQRFNRIWAGRDAYAADEGDISPVTRFKTMRGALTAFWTGEKWAQAWAGTGVTLGVATLNAQNTVWVSEAGAALANSIGELLFKQDPSQSMQPIIDSAQTLGAFGALFIAGFTVQDFLKMDLQRRMAGWMTGKFNEAVLDQPDTVYRMTHNRDPKSEAGDVMPEGPHQRMSGAIGQAVKQFTNFGVGGWSAVMTAAFVGKALYDKSMPVGFLNDLGAFLNEKFPNGVIDFVPGDSGTFALAMTTVAAYSAVMFPLAMKLGKKLEETGNEIQKTGAAHMETLVSMFSRGQALAESGGNVAQKKILDKVYEDVDKAWHHDNVALTKYMSFSFMQGFMGYHLIAAIPGLAGALSRSLTFKGFLESQMLTGAMLQSVGFFFNMIPTVQSMKSAVGRINGMAAMIDLTQDKKSFYELSGVHDFKMSPITEADTGDLLRVKDLTLYHRGQNEPFVKIDKITIRKGDQILVEGESGGGKSSVFSALAGKYPYGSGTMEVAPGTTLFFARQKTDIDPHLTLADQVVYGAESVILDFAPDKARIEWALNAVGLGKFAANAGLLTHEGKSWPEVLSGGQEQRLVLARILYQQPDLVLLDEATSALNPEARQDFFRILRAHCPDATVMAIMHTDLAPGQGGFRYNKRLHIGNGGGEMQDVTAGRKPVAAQQLEMGAHI